MPKCKSAQSSSKRAASEQAKASKKQQRSNTPSLSSTQNTTEETKVQTCISTQINTPNKVNNSKSSLQSTAMDKWAYTKDNLAWAPVKPSSQNNKKPKDLQSKSQTANNNTLHPCILFPSWAVAMTSEIITDSPDSIESHKNHSLRLIGCKRSIAVRDLKRNRVPARVALGSGANGSKYRPKVVVHYLGLGNELSWGAVTVGSVKKYTLESCKEICENLWNLDGGVGGGVGVGVGVGVESGRKKNHKRVKPELFLAMQEASIVMDRPEFDPSNILRDLSSLQASNINNSIRQEPHSSVNKKDGELFQLNEHTKSVEGGDSHKEIEENMTPENFDDWRLGGNTQKYTQSQSQNFSQGIVSTCSVGK